MQIEIIGGDSAIREMVAKVIKDKTGMDSQAEPPVQCGDWTPDPAAELAQLRRKVAAAEQMAEALEKCLSPLQDAQNQLRHIAASRAFLGAKSAITTWKEASK